MKPENPQNKNGAPRQECAAQTRRAKPSTITSAGKQGRLRGKDKIRARRAARAAERVTIAGTAVMPCAVCGADTRFESATHIEVERCGMLGRAVAVCKTCTDAEFAEHGSLARLAARIRVEAKAPQQEAGHGR